MPSSRNRSRERNPRSRSRERDRERRDRSRKRSRSRSYNRRDKEKDRRRSRSRSYDRRRGRERDDRRRRERSRSYDRRDRRHDRSKSFERKERYKEKYSSENSEKKYQNSGGLELNNSSSSAVKPIVIIANNNHSKSSKQKSIAERTSTSSQSNNDHREIFEISNEFSKEGFEQFSRDHGIDFSNIKTDEDREAVHEKMQELLKAHFAAQGKVYPPPPKEEKQPAINAIIGFSNDGSFLEQFKKMQEQQKQQAEIEQKNRAENLSNQLPIIRRRGGKILKTGIVAKTKLNNQERSSDNVPSNAWGMYIKEVQKYKGSSCDSDSKNRPLVK